jgi:hypothetical protein
MTLIGLPCQRRAAACLVSHHSSLHQRVLAIRALDVSLSIRSTSPLYSASERVLSHGTRYRCPPIRLAKDHILRHCMTQHAVICAVAMPILNPTTRAYPRGSFTGLDRHVVELWRIQRSVSRSKLFVNGSAASHTPLSDWWRASTAHVAAQDPCRR